MNHRFFIILLVLLWLQQNPVAVRTESFDSVLDHPIRVSTYNPGWMESAVLIATNQARAAHRLQPVTLHAALQRSAEQTSREQARNGTLSHISRDPERQFLEDRLKQEGIPLVNVTLAENLGVDYILKIANRPFYMDSTGRSPYPVDAGTRKPVPPYTYRQFARTMVSHWMASPGHRKNLLNPRFKWMGVGAVLGSYRGFESIYVTQHFLGPLRSYE